jgi:hypothetical protein
MKASVIEVKLTLSLRRRRPWDKAKLYIIPFVIEKGLIVLWTNKIFNGLCVWC